MSFLKELQSKRKQLNPTETIVTTATGERFVENILSTGPPIQLENTLYGFVEDTKPDTIPAEILNNFLFLGSQDAVALENITRYNFTHILSLGVSVNTTGLGGIIKQKYLPLLDLPETKLFDCEFIDEALQFIKVADECNGRVLVHCNAGVSRAPSVVIAYLMLCKNFSFDEAHDLVKSKRECIQPNAGFMRQLREYRE